METLSHNIIWSKIDRQFAWIITISLVIMGFPLIKNIIIPVLEKIYELFIQQGIGK